MFESTGFNQFNMPEIEHIGYDETLKEEVREYEKPNNERLLPTTKETLGEKKFLYGLWLCLQEMSKGICTDNFRYVKVDEVNNSALANRITAMTRPKGSKEYYEKPIDRRTVAKGMKYLKDMNFIVGVVDGNEVIEGYKGEYYKMKNRDTFEYYIKMNVDFIKMLSRSLTQDAIKVYMVYYSFNRDEVEGQCFLTQERILERIGLSKSGDNCEKLTYINIILEELGLIEKYVKIQRENGREVKRNNIIVAPLYWKTKLYDRLQKVLETKGEIGTREVELLKVS
ncbi:helix-turn-helix domain-containing protein [Clostridium sp. K04]|uniref:helix-turn-helix domain-containing protein n=1 Tax=Clostridium sp. K04 TaxID=2718929 RepID=UPI001C8BC6A6|nr:helix-turn-helix domain-containing protein [Clostridium sp. K04]MBX9185676.1 hypothetical protein [Clostridium sp. K04]